MLILCPECSHSISDQALACPNCGYPVAIIPNTRRRAHSTRRKLPNGTGSIKTAAGKNRIVPIHDAILPFARDFSPGSFRASVFRNNKFYPALEQLGISYTANFHTHYAFLTTAVTQKIFSSIPAKISPSILRIRVLQI